MVKLERTLTFIFLWISLSVANVAHSLPLACGKLFPSAAVFSPSLIDSKFAEYKNSTVAYVEFASDAIQSIFSGPIRVSPVHFASHLNKVIISYRELLEALGPEAVQDPRFQMYSDDFEMFLTMNQQTLSKFYDILTQGVSSDDQKVGADKLKDEINRLNKVFARIGSNFHLEFSLVHEPN